VAFIFTAQEHAIMKDILKTEEIVSVLKKVLSTSLWTGDKQLSEFLKDPLLRACAWYLYKEKRRGYALNNVGMFFIIQCTRIIYSNKYIIFFLNNLCAPQLISIYAMEL